MMKAVSYDRLSGDLPQKFEEENDFLKDRKRLLKTMEFRKKIKDYKSALFNNLSHEFNSENNKNDNQKDSDEIYARQLQVDYDKEYAASFEFNSENNNDDNQNVIGDDDTIGIVDYFFTGIQENLNQTVVENNSIDVPKYEGDEIYARQLQIDYDQEYAASLEFNSDDDSIGIVDSFFTGMQENLNQTIINGDDYETLIQLEQSNIKISLNNIEIESLPCFPFKEKNLDQQENQCSICFDSYLKDEKLISLACLHKFHAKCIKEWLKYYFLFRRQAENVLCVKKMPFMAINNLVQQRIVLKMDVSHMRSYGSHSRYILKTCDVRVMFNFNY
ncbi:E3 ubiquitin ligase BIG BROTHER-related-like [Brachionus plicatilis]|uniref:E3 ubiquitin ligase BIG BROTHER-related-like n=1 Tax=Brachionus plicatilis TaxID=10195 RepID=A0A3M7QEQ1_BRAPC|nr:E3 ubiquitin ligase BIG BROTHER-related-like [Brachionus plicatilis]